MPKIRLKTNFSVTVLGSKMESGQVVAGFGAQPSTFGSAAISKQVADHIYVPATARYLDGGLTVREKRVAVN